MKGVRFSRMLSRLVVAYDVQTREFFALDTNPRRSHDGDGINGNGLFLLMLCYE